MPELGLSFRQIRPGGGGAQSQLRWNVSGDPWLGLYELAHLRQFLEVLEAEAVEVLREPPDVFSWAEIGSALGQSGEAVRLRHGTPARRAPGAPGTTD